MKEKRSTVRVLTVSDLHQSRMHFQNLERAVAEHCPDILAVVGDVLDALSFDERRQFTTNDCAGFLTALPVSEILFVRGNHEDANWSEFVGSWPHEHRPLAALYGTSASLGSSRAKVIGFPCLTGSEFSWCAHFDAHNGRMIWTPSEICEELPPEHEAWLPRLLQQTGPAGRALWLLHEPPVRSPLACADLHNPEWRRAIQRYQPLLTISGHDHITPLRTGQWYTTVGNTVCVNVGQSDTDLHYCVLDFESVEADPLPRRITVEAFPWRSRKIISPATGGVKSA